MDTEANPAETAVIELMVSWGATAAPGAREMFEALASAIGADPREPLRRLLEQEPDALDAALRDEIAAVCGAAAGALPAASRIEALTIEGGRALRDAARARRELLEADLGKWAGLLEPADRDAIWTSLWQAERGDGLEDGLDALAALRESAERLDRARQRVREEIGAFLQAPEGADAEALEAARQALEAGEPALIATARARLRDLSAHARIGELQARADGARSRLSELRENAGRMLVDSGDDLGAASREILESGLARADALLSATAAATAEQVERVLPAIESWARTLAVALDAQGAREDVDRHRELAAWVDDLVREVEASSMDGAADAGEEARAIISELKAGAGEAPSALHAAGARAMAWLESAQGRRTEDLQRAGEELGPARRALEEQLERSASSLPTERVIEARLLLERIDEALARGKVDDARALGETVRDLTPELERLAESYREYRSGREAAEWRRVKSEAEGWLELAGKRDAARIEALSAEIEKADADRLTNLRDRLDAAGARIGNAIRLDAAKTLRRAGSALGRSGGRPGAEQLRADVERLQVALEADDLPALAEATAATREGLRGAARLGWPLRLAVIGILAVVIGGGGFWAWRTRSAADTLYEFRLAPGADTSTGARLTLVLDGEVASEQSFDADGTARLKLSGGRYDVYVNGAFTGRVLRVPDDPPEVTDIPLPR